MAENTVKIRYRHAIKTEAEWTYLNPILLSGEVAYSSDKNGKYKIGNGTSTWNQLPYAIPATKTDIGLGSVENKSSATIRGELTKANVTNALGYTPPTTNTTYGVATSSTLGLVKSGTDITVDSSGNVSVNDNSHNHSISNISGLQDKLNLKAENVTLTNQDLNTVTTPGFYNAGGSNTVTNKPSNIDYFGLIVIHNANGSYYTQILFNSTSSYRRFCVNGNWGSWTQDKLTDTNTWRGIQNNLTSDSTTDSLSAAQGKALKALVDAKSSLGHTHDDRYYTESEMDTKLNAKLNTSLKGVSSGLAELDSTGRVPSNQLPSYVDDVIEGYLYNSKFYKESAHTTQITGETGKIYVDLTSNKTYRWSGSSFVVISETLALGETSTTAYRGDRGKIAYDHSQVVHAPSNAEVNQNAFSNVVIGSTTIAADSKTDTLTLVAGSNVTITPDATNDKITISSTDTNNKVAQTAVTDSSYTNWRSLIWGASNSSTEGFAPTTVTDGVFSCTGLSVQPSTGTIRASVFKGKLTGNANTATKLQTSRTINGTSFDGSANITTLNWGTGRTLTIGNSGKSVNGSTNVGWTLNEIGALPQIIGYYGSDVADTNGWYKVCTISQSGYSDYSLNLLITHGYNRQATGVLHIHTRCDNSTTITIKSLKWMYRYGFNANDVKVVTGDNTWSLYVMNTNTRYGRIQVQVISKSGTSGDTSFTLSNNTTKESSEPGGTSATDGATVNYANSSGTASKLSTARTISLTGSVTGSGTFDGSGNLSITTTTNHTHSYLPLSGGTLTGDVALPITKSSVDASLPVSGATMSISDITSLSNYKTYLGSYNHSGTWYNLISTRHRNGSGDGTSYGMYLRSTLTGSGNLTWGKQYGTSSWQAERTIIDSSNYTSYTVTKTGSGASGSWGISVTGSSASCTGNAVTATKATQDSAGQQINTTYIKGLSVSGKTVTYTKGDGSTGTITTQDTNTTYSAGTGISLSGTTFSNSGVRSISTGGTNGTISVNTNGTSAEVAVKGLGSAAYTASSNYATSGHTHSYLPLNGGTLTISSYYGLIIKRSDANGAAISYQNSNGALGGAGFLSDGTFQISSSTNTNGNIFKATTTSATFPGTIIATTFSGNATSATKLTTSAGSATQPVYFSDGKPVACTYTLGKSVPSDAVFTDTKVQTATTNPTSATTYYVPFTTGATTGTLAINDGLTINSLQGTNDAEGYDRLCLGNNTATGTAGNKSGSLRLYGTGSGYVTFKPYNNDSSSYTRYLVGTGSSAAVGSSTKPVYVSSSGTVTACTYTLGKSVPSDAVFTDTHYTSHLYVGASGGNTNATSATSNPYLLCVDNTTNRNSIQLKAGSNMSISAVNGVITFTATNSTNVGSATTISLQTTCFSGTCYVRKIGDVFCEIYNGQNSSKISTLKTARTIPAYSNYILTSSNLSSEFIPSKGASIPIRIVANNESYPGILGIDSNGSISLYNLSAVEIPSGAGIYFGGIYSVA